MNEQEIQVALEKKGATKCPVCGHAEYDVGPPDMLTAGSGTSNPANLELITIICKRCGHVRYHAVIRLNR